jgi:hypothetical protein
MQEINYNNISHIFDLIFKQKKPYILSKGNHLKVYQKKIKVYNNNTRLDNMIVNIILSEQELKKFKTLKRQYRQEK